MNVKLSLSLSLSGWDRDVRPSFFFFSPVRFGLSLQRWAACPCTIFSGGKLFGSGIGSLSCQRAMSGVTSWLIACHVRAIGVGTGVARSPPLCLPLFMLVTHWSLTAWTCNVCWSSCSNSTVESGPLSGLCPGSPPLVSVLPLIIVGCFAASGWIALHICFCVCHIVRSVDLCAPSY